MTDSGTYCVILAGGIGSRFWPMSQYDKPKQFLDILGVGKSLLRQTYDRMGKIVKPENILVVTLKDYIPLVKEQIPELSEENIIGEPVRRDTAPSVALAAHILAKKNPDSRMIIAPSDHLIQDEQVFIDIIEKAVNFIKDNDALLTLGIKPNRPETGYGYIQVNNSYEEMPLPEKISKVKVFTEKPDLELAKIFFESGEFLWNSGLFFWTAGAILSAYDLYEPEMGDIFSGEEEYFGTAEQSSAMERIYSRIKTLSVDYAIMEKSENVFVMEAEFGWSDLGTWSTMYERIPHDANGNTVSRGQVFSYNNKNCLVYADNNKIAVVEGLDNYIVIASGNTFLVCSRDREQDIKAFVKDVKLKMRKDRL